MEAKGDIEGLVKALGHQKDPYVRRTLAWALGKIGDARAVKPLIAVLMEPLISASVDGDRWLLGFNVREAAIEALGKIYHNHRLDAVSKQRILALQEKFPRKHTDKHGWDSQCQQATHSDHWSGLEL